ncbi:unnamed protein product [Darwinula stevensoni]|uniref:Uncharacterized protein n=1 Tax=Darwinula stevensoni TaxID=69355 RepID=A0A7R9A7W7_9CRUS|nr:unnamed protein product [Darwinula stevensoni]CAG0895390.1 unnamed protein product [Darwinula stevensoni]
MEIYDEECNEFVEVDLTRLPDEAKLWLRFEGSNEIREFFEQCDPHGLDYVNAVAFVLPSYTAMLTTSQKYIFHAITRLFGIDMKEKFALLRSFCDGQEPAAIVLVRNANLFY